MARIVLVEDDVMLAEIYQTRITLAGFECLVAYDGSAGLELIKQTMPDLVLLDLMLPQLSGDKVLEKMRDTIWGKNIKVVFLTNISESEAPKNLSNMNFEGYLVKANISNNQLVEAINEVLNPTTTT